MHKVSAKRQITIPKEFCEKAGIEPGNMVEILEYEGKDTVIKQEAGLSAGILKNVQGKARKKYRAANYNFLRLSLKTPDWAIRLL